LASIDALGEQLQHVERTLRASRPVAILFHPDVLSRPARPYVPLPPTPKGFSRADVNAFLAELPAQIEGRRVVVYVCDEAARCPGIQALTTRLAEALSAPMVWSVNGANAVSHDNPHGYGYISFGGNDEAMKLWRSVGPEDIVLTLGFDPGEFAIDLQSITAGHVWHLGAFEEGFGHHDGEFAHRITGQYHRVRGDVGLILADVLPHLERLAAGRRPGTPAPAWLNTRTIARPTQESCVDLVAFYEAIHRLSRPNSVGFDDVCVSFKDRQYVGQRPHPNIRFYNSQDGAAMGGAFGFGIGAKLADPSLHTFVLSGDGCFRLYGAALSEAAGLDLRLFILNNGTFALVETMLDVVLPDVERPRYHGKLPRCDYGAMARAQGWDAYRLKPDLSNLPEIMDVCSARRGRSILVDVPVDDRQLVGYNPRVDKVSLETYL